ncbi:putative adhesin [Streptomyces sp. NPDC059918]|uniref:putative adhesin n=1 Tax=unclassified Streptomyces TaxID=2593676 RepID=UPI0036626E4B
MYWEHCVRHSIVPSPSYEGMLTEAEHADDADDAGEDGTGAWMIAAAFAEWLLLTTTVDDASDVAHNAPLFASDPRSAVARVLGLLDEADREIPPVDHYQRFLDTYENEIGSRYYEDEGITRPVADLAFVSGHGCGMPGFEKTFVPRGMTLHFLSEPGKGLFTSHALAVLSRGRDFTARQSYSAGDRVPNYMLFPELCALDEAVAHQANESEATLFLVGGEELPLIEESIALCWAPKDCAREGEHRCEGVLGRLREVKELVFMTCRGQSGSASCDNWRLPDEKVPLFAAKTLRDTGRNRMRSTGDLIRILETADGPKRAQLLTDPRTRTKLARHAARGLGRREGDLAYLAMYLGADQWERAAFDGDDELSEAGRRAEALVQGFAAADTESRQILLQQIIKGRTNQQARAQADFLSSRIPGWAGWTELGDDWHPFERWNLDVARDLSERPTLKAVTMACLTGGDDTFLIAPAAGELANRFRQAFKNTSVLKFAIAWEPAGPDDDRKRFVMRVSRQAEETGIVRFMTSLVRLVNGQGTLLATA